MATNYFTNIIEILPNLRLTIKNVIYRETIYWEVQPRIKLFNIQIKVNFSMRTIKYPFPKIN